MPYIILGAGSNILVRDGGFKGIVFKLGKSFNQLSITNNNLESNSAEIQPGINPFVTGLANKSTNAKIIPILVKSSIIFLNFNFFRALFLRLLINLIVLKLTFFT